MKKEKKLKKVKKLKLKFLKKKKIRYYFRLLAASCPAR